MIWLDGTLVPWREARLHVLSHSLHYGSAVFEGERIYGGHIFKLTEHSSRLIRSCQLLNYESPYGVDVLDSATKEVVATNQISSGYVRPIAWRGSEAIGVSSEGLSVHVAITAFEWPPYYGEAGERGLHLMTSQWVRAAPNSAPCHSKAAGLYMICTLSRDAAKRRGFDDALMLDYAGRIAEASAANIFLVFDNELHTPTPDCFLDGITRRTVMDLARLRSIPVVERAILPEELTRASEVFLTGTAAEVTPVSRIDQANYPVGPLTRQLKEDYQRLTRVT